MLRDRTFSAANVAILLFGLGFFGAVFLLVQYLTVTEGYSALKAAFAITPFSGCIMLTGPLAGRLTDRFGPRPMVLAGVFLFGAAMYSASLLEGGVPYPQIAWRLVVGGIGMGLTFAPLTSAAMGTVAGGRAGVGAGVFNAARQVGFTLGVAILVAVFLGALPGRISAAQEEAVTLVEQSELPAPAKQGIIEGILSVSTEEMEEAARSGEKPTIDLYEQVKQTVGAEVADPLRPTLDELSDELQTIFARSTGRAFGRAFLVGAIFVWVGVVPALLLGRGPRAASGRPAAAMG